MSMLGYVEKITVRPQDITTADVDSLRSVGFTDRDIHDICEVAAYYAYVNRIADGLGVQLESWLPDD
jgi:alkylhydroperoxidase family enzyme